MTAVSKPASALSKLLDICRSFPNEGYKIPEKIMFHPSDYAELLKSEELHTMFHPASRGVVPTSGITLLNAEIYPDIQIPEGEVHFVSIKKLENVQK